MSIHFLSRKLFLVFFLLLVCLHIHAHAQHIHTLKRDKIANKQQRKKAKKTVKIEFIYKLIFDFINLI